MTTTTDPYLVHPTTPPRRKVAIQNGGAHRGARLNIPAFREFNLESTAVELVPVYTDPLPGRAEALREEAMRQGVAAGAVESKIEDYVTAVSSASTDPFLLNLDRASGHESVIRQTRNSGRAVLGYLILRLPRGELWGLRYVLGARDLDARDGGAALFGALAEASERNTSGSVFGEGADPSHVLIEPVIRRWFADHAKKNLAKLVAALEPATATFEVTSDGDETLPLIISVQDRWSTPTALAERVVESPASPIRKGIRFVVAEVVPTQGVRLHRVRRRTDDRVTVGGTEVIDRASMEAFDAVRETELRRQAAQALARAERRALSRRNPIFTTD